MKPLRVGIVGRGFGAMVHAPAFRSVAGVEVVGIAGSKNWRDIINNPHIDIVSIATPPASQCELVCNALAAGKHVLCEKPFGLNATEARRMWDTAQDRGLVTAIGFQFRFEDGIHALQQTLGIPGLGMLQRFDVAWLFQSPAASLTQRSWKNDVQAGGGIINAFASHVVDYLEWISGRTVTRVNARAEQICEIDAEMTAGLVSSMKISNACSPAVGHKIEIHAENGKVSYFHAAPFGGVQPEMCIELENESPRKTTFAAVSGPDSRLAAFAKLVAAFVQKVSGNSAPDVPDFAVGVRVRTVLDAIQESARRESWVSVSAR